MFIANTVHEEASPAADEVIVSGIDDEDNIPCNVLLRGVAELKAKLVDVPHMIPNPARHEPEQQLMAAARLQFDKEQKARTAERDAAKALAVDEEKARRTEEGL